MVLDVKGDVTVASLVNFIEKTIRKEVDVHNWKEIDQLSNYVSSSVQNIKKGAKHNILVVAFLPNFTCEGMVKK